MLTGSSSRRWVLLCPLNNIFVSSFLFLFFFYSLPTHKWKKHLKRDWKWTTIAVKILHQQGWVHRRKWTIFMEYEPFDFRVEITNTPIIITNICIAKSPKNARIDEWPAMNSSRRGIIDDPDDPRMDSSMADGSHFLSCRAPSCKDLQIKKKLLWITWPRDDGKISSVTVGEPYFVCLSVRKDQQSPLEAIWVGFMEPPARFKSHEICPSSRWWQRGHTARLEIRASIGWCTRLIILFTDFTIRTEGPIITSLY